MTAYVTFPGKPPPLRRADVRHRGPSSYSEAELAGLSILTLPSMTD